MHQQVIGCYTGLTGIDAFPPGNSPGGNGKIRSFIYDARAFTSQFQNDRCQVFGCSRHHNLPKCRTSREEDQVERLIQQQLVYLSSTLNDGNIGRVKDLLDQLLHHGGNVGCIGRWFQNGTATRGDGSYQRIEQKLKRIVPGSDDQGRSQRF